MIGKLSNNRHDETMEKRIDFGKVLAIIHTGKDDYIAEGEKGVSIYIHTTCLLRIEEKVVETEDRSKKKTSCWQLTLKRNKTIFSLEDFII